MRESCVDIESFLHPSSQVKKYFQGLAVAVTQKKGVYLISHLVFVIGMQEISIGTLFFIREGDETHDLFHLLDPVELTRQSSTFFFT